MALGFLKAGTRTRVKEKARWRAREKVESRLRLRHGVGRELLESAYNFIAELIPQEGKRVRRVGVAVLPRLRSLGAVAPGGQEP